MKIENHVKERNVHITLCILKDVILANGILKEYGL